MNIDEAANQSDDLAWFKSSYSGPNGGDCVEVAVAVAADSVRVRDSKAAADGPMLRVGRDEWAAFVAHAGR